MIKINNRWKVKNKKMRILMIKKLYNLRILKICNKVNNKTDNFKMLSNRCKNKIVSLKRKQKK